MVNFILQFTRKEAKYIKTNIGKEYEEKEKDSESPIDSFRGTLNYEYIHSFPKNELKELVQKLKIHNSRRTSKS